MKNLALYSFTISFGVFLNSCGGRGDTELSYEELRRRPPAANSEEWKERFEAYKNSWSLGLDDLYAELPEQNEWPEIITALKTAEPSSDRREKKTSLAFEVFALLLDNDGPIEARTAYQEYILNGEKLYEYEAASVTRTLIRMGVSTEDATDFVEKHSVLEREESETLEDTVDGNLWKRKLAAGNIDEGIRLLRKALTAPESDANSRGQIWATLYKVADLMDLKELRSEALVELEKRFFSQEDDYFSYLSTEDRLLLDYWVETEQWQTLLDAAEKRLKNANKNPYSLQDEDPLLEYRLLAIAHLKDSNELLEHLGQLPEQKIDTKESYISFLATNPSLTPLISAAYREIGDLQSSLSLLHHQAAVASDDDRAYLELVTHHPDSAKEIFDQIRAFNPFEERPLIWLADFSLRAGNLTQARELIEKAIQLDPSDGDQGKETRMEAYRVLADVFAAEGDNENAKFYREVLVAIREGEKADDYLEAGLRSEAIRRYREALSHFEDAYCLQSRLAKSLLEHGDLEAAKIHLEKAFKLMPVSFGPVESHCFGCEGIFETPEEQLVAEKVFNEMIESDPNNPRTYYLIALLFEEQGKMEKALESFVKAFEVDPSYYNSAKKIAQYMYLFPGTTDDFKATKQKIDEIIPYAFLSERFSSRVDLRSSWKEADELVGARENPLSLPEFPLPFQEPEKPQARHSYLSTEIYALDGWTRDELLRGNELLSDLNY